MVRPTNKVQTESRPSENSWPRGGTGGNPHAAPPLVAASAFA
jgi:hypothetical protein